MEVVVQQVVGVHAANAQQFAHGRCAQQAQAQGQFEHVPALAPALQTQARWLDAQQREKERCIPAHALAKRPVSGRVRAQRAAAGDGGAVYAQARACFGQRVRGHGGGGKAQTVLFQRKVAQQGLGQRMQQVRAG